MALIRYQVRKAKNRKERAQGKRFIAQAVFPGGRAIIFDRSRTRPPAVTKLAQVVRTAAQEYDTATQTTPSGGGGGGGGGTGNSRGLRRPNINLE